jgi:eukaryotic-like serine/threonine-protein kinase
VGADDDWTGRTIDGRYVVEDTLGVGGMGVVLRARHAFTGERVAIKMLRPQLELNADMQARFLAESRAPSAIGHPGIVRVLDAGKTPEGALYLAMELLEGRSLRVPVARGELSEHEMRRVLLELLDALGAAHARGFVHRDLKPENVFLAGAAGTVKLLDFGIAKVMTPGPGSARTAAGVVMGTLAYMAPEQLHDASSVDARADLWAAGVILFEMIARRLPFSARTLEELFIAVATHEPEPIRRYVPGAPPVLHQFFARALARDPRQRFASAGEMASALTALPLGVGPSAPIAPMAAPPGASWIDPRSATESGTQASAPPVRARPVSSVPPMAYAATQAHVPQPPRPPQAMPMISAAPSQGHGRRRWILGGAVIAAMIAVAFAASRGGGGRDGRAPGDASAVAVAAPDAERAPPPPDPVPTPEPQPPMPLVPDQLQPNARHAPPAPAPASDPCTDGCKKLIACGSAPPNVNCVEECRRNDSIRACLASSKGACGPYAMCAFQTVCGTQPRGAWTCQRAAGCQGFSCQIGDAACACNCMAQMAPSHAAALMALDGCGVACNGDHECMSRRCQNLIDHCNAQ